MNNYIEQSTQSHLWKALKHGEFSECTSPAEPPNWGRVSIRCSEERRHGEIRSADEKFAEMVGFRKKLGNFLSQQFSISLFVSDVANNLSIWAPRCHPQAWSHSLRRPSKDLFCSSLKTLHHSHQRRSFCSQRQLSEDSPRVRNERSHR